MDPPVDELQFIMASLSDVLEVLHSLGYEKGVAQMPLADLTRAGRLARMIVRAEEVFGSMDKALDWLRDPNTALGDVTPLSLLDADHGARRVEAVLGRIEHGVHS